VDSAGDQLRQLQEKCEAFCLDERNWDGKWRGRSPKGRANFRLIYSSPNTFESPSQIMILGTNPGGYPRDADLNDAWLPFIAPKYSAYLEERWGSYDKGHHPIQKAVFAVAAALSGNRVKGRELLYNTPTGNLIPFRSSRYPGELSDRLREKGLEYGLRLLEIARPRMLVLISSRKELWERVMEAVGHLPAPDDVVDLTPPGDRDTKWTLREALVSEGHPAYIWALPGLNSSATDHAPIINAFRNRLRHHGINR